MTILERVALFLRKLLPSRVGPKLSRTGETTISTAPREPINDAVAYGVTIQPAIPTPGSWYWQAVRVHHLTPEENGGRHHIFLDLFDPSLGDGGTPYGKRVYGGRLRITWDGGEQIVTVDKPANEPGTNFPMWRWQVCTVEALGMPGAELPSDRVTGLHTGHPDEAPGNTLFHHSFSVTFVKVKAPDVVYTDSVLSGFLRNAGGRTALLFRGDVEVARQLLGPDGGFRFTDLGPGEYVVGVEGLSFRSQPVRLDGRNQAQIEHTLVLAESVISGRVRNGAGRVLRLIREDVEVAETVVAEDETYRFDRLAAGVYRVLVAGTQVGSPPITLDGIHAMTADLLAPASGKLLAHYVLFGPAGDPKTRANLLLAQDYLLAFRPTFGFRPEEAAAAGMITIIADEEQVSAQVADELAADGVPVQRIAGSVDQVAEALAARVAARQAF
ncbi:MAG: hypothetical protein N2204_04040 [Anaerolineae bacterium]|nr:hypothetical protein [Anaerolineae bacterium]